MDLNIIIISAVLVVICAFPFFFVMINGKKRRKNMKKILQEIAINKGSRLASFDFTGKIAIGTDDNVSQLFFYRAEDPHPVQAQINLAEVKDCRVQKERSTNKNGTGREDLEKLLLIFTLKDSSPKTTSWVFYDSGVDWQMNNELNLVEKWNLLIHQNLSTKTRA